MENNHESAISRQLLTTPVHNLDAERCVLSGCIANEGVAIDATSRITDACFYGQAHRDTFSAINSLLAKGRAVSLVSVVDEAKALGYKSCSPVLIAEIASEYTTNTAAVDAIGVVRQKAIRRLLAESGATMIHRAYDPAANVVEEVGEAIKKLETEITQDEKHDVSLNEALAGYLDYLTAEKGEAGAKIYTPWSEMNTLISHIETGEVVIIGARPSNCKSLLASQLVICAAEQGYPAGFISLEMPRNQLISRWCACGSGVEAWKFRAQELNRQDLGLVYDYTAQIEQLQVQIWDDPFITPDQMRSLVSEWVRKYGLKILVLDYLQLVNNSKANGSREREVAEVSRLMKALAVKHNIAVVMLSQVNREVERRTSQRLKLSDLRESGAAEQDADIVWLIQPFEPKTDARVVPLQVSVAKSRSSATGDAWLDFDRTYLQIRDRGER